MSKPRVSEKARRNSGVTDCLFDWMATEDLWAVTASRSRSPIVRTDEIHSDLFSRRLLANILTIEFFDTEGRVQHTSVERAEQGDPTLILPVLFCAAFTPQRLAGVQFE